MKERPPFYMAFDQAPRFTGWATGPADPTAVPRWGTIVGSDYGDDDQRMMADLAKDLRGLFDKYQPEAIFFEQIVIDQRHVNLPITYAQFAVAATILFVAMEYGIPAEMVIISEWRKRFLGRSNMPKHAGKRGQGREWLKEAAKIECARRGWLTDSDHEAEALAILDFGLAAKSTAYRFATKADVERRQQKARKENMEK